MGKILTKGLKNRALAVFEATEGRFSTDFERNKAVIRGLELPYSKRVNDMITGFITRSVKQKKKLAEQEAAFAAAEAAKRADVKPVAKPSA